MKKNSDVLVAAIETTIVLDEGKETERELASSFTPWGYGKNDTMPPLIIPVESFETIQLHELRLEQWMVTAIDSDGDVRIADYMRDSL